MELEEIDIPRPAAGEVLVHVEASGVNYIDIYDRTGVYAQALPATIGREGAGTVAEVGEGVSEFQIGRPGSVGNGLRLVCRILRPSCPRLVPVPDGVSSTLAAAVMLQGMTAHYLTRTRTPSNRATRAWSTPPPAVSGCSCVRWLRRAAHA